MNEHQSERIQDAIDKQINFRKIYNKERQSIIDYLNGTYLKNFFQISLGTNANSNLGIIKNNGDSIAFFAMLKCTHEELIGLDFNIEILAQYEDVYGWQFSIKYLSTEWANVHEFKGILFDNCVNKLSYDINEDL